MYVCYLDEAGCTGSLPSATSDIQPVLVVGALFVHHDEIPSLTHEYLTLKRQMFPPTGPERFLDLALSEVKGSDIRRDYCDSDRRKHRRATAFLYRVLKLCEDHRMKFVAKIFVKEIGGQCNGRAMYGSAVQFVCKHFQHSLTAANSKGIMIADARFKAMNVATSHSVFTRKHCSDGDHFNRIIEVPTYGHGESHVGLQIADLLCSGLAFPIAVHSYCKGHVTSVHVRPQYAAMKSAYSGHISALQYRYPDHSGRMSGGVVVSDGLLKKRTAALFFH